MTTHIRHVSTATPGVVAGLGAQLVLLALLWAALRIGPSALAAGSACAVVTCATLGYALHRTRARTFGQANWVTLFRATLVGGVTALVADGLVHGPATAAIVALSVVALILDGVDGQVARRTGTATAVGARFDMEVDAFLILVLSVFVAASLGPWVLIIGGMRYAFVAASWVAPWLKGALPPSFARKTVAAAQGVLLVVAASGLLPALASVAVVGIALASLVWSFGRDVIWLWRNR
ncbi:MAG TPA: CDP-alcohol phosphatidyltransferase family protein [Kutzneria sp.]